MQAGFAVRPGCGLRSSRLAGEGDAWDMLQIVEEAELVPVGQQRRNGFALVVANLESEQAVGLESGARLGNESAIDVQTVRTGEECGGGFVIAHLGMERCAVGGRNVGRV